MLTRLSTPVALAALLSLAAVPPASAQFSSARVRIPPVQLTLASATRGVIQGVVADATGRPLSGAMVSALGSTVAFALSGQDGRFLLDSLPMGDYTVRVHLDGYLPSRRHLIEVRGGTPALVTVALHSLTVPASATTSNAGPRVIAAGFAPFDAVPSAKKAVDEGDSEPDHSETAWRLRHLKRSVLKSIDGQTMLVGEVASGASDAASRFGRAFDSSIRVASAASALPPITGQVNVLTSGSYGAASVEPVDAMAVPAGVASVAFGAPVGSFGSWAVRGAMSQGELASWFLAGTFSGRTPGAHRLSGGLAYGMQHVEPLNLLARAAMTSGSRAIGSVFVVDDWAVTKRLSLSYGMTYAWQDYLTSDALLSPRVSLTVAPTKQTRIRAVFARTASAPGAEELLPTAASDEGTWLPAQRTFSAWSEGLGFRAQTTNHFEFAIERSAHAFLIGFRTYYQSIDDQMGTVFAAATLDHPAASLGHYYLATVGDAHARGWTVSVSRPIVRGLRGAIDYSQTTAKWTGFGGEGEPGREWFGSTGVERFHDLTTSLQTDIPQTATRLYVLYRVNTAFVRPERSGDAAMPGTRFDVQLNQGLPFLGFTSADWEVLFAVRNLFRDPTTERSVFDELLVVRPPTRIVGGVRVRF